MSRTRLLDDKKEMSTEKIDKNREKLKKYVKLWQTESEKKAVEDEKKIKFSPKKHPLPVNIAIITPGSNQNPIEDWLRLSSTTMIDNKLVSDFSEMKEATTLEPFLTKYLLLRFPKELINEKMKGWLTRCAHQTGFLGFIYFPMMSALAQKGYTPQTVYSSISHHFMTNSTGFEVEEHYIQYRMIKNKNQKVYQPDASHTALLEAKSSLIVDLAEFSKTGKPIITVKAGGYLIYGSEKIQKLFVPPESNQFLKSFKDAVKKLTQTYHHYSVGFFGKPEPEKPIVDTSVKAVLMTQELKK